MDNNIKILKLKKVHNDKSKPKPKTPSPTKKDMGTQYSPPKK